MDDTEYEAFIAEMYLTLKKHTCMDIDVQKIYKIRDLKDSLKMSTKQWCKWLITPH